MSENENKVLARRFIQVWVLGNVGLVNELAAPGITVIYPVLGEPVCAAPFKQLQGKFHAACPDGAGVDRDHHPPPGRRQGGRGAWRGGGGWTHSAAGA